jgi:hypothetical protein
MLMARRRALGPLGRTGGAPQTAVCWIGYHSKLSYHPASLLNSYLKLRYPW